ncbi:hypothetical protein JB92DRAFT_2789445 [Gautieria morchelliformis]|nr:hypothetical protein JB92DRAFT_2789445 [Gautieria morchelliformis]
MANISNTFSRPPIDGTLTVDQLYDWHRVHSPRAAAFVFPKDNGLQTTLTWKALADGITKGAEIIQSSIPVSQGTNNQLQQRDPIVVGILATADVITYTTFIFSHIRLTHPSTSGRPLLPFPISPRNSAAAVAHLVHTTGVKYLWVTEGPMRAIAEEALGQGGLVNTMIMTFPSFAEMYSSIPDTILSASEKHDHAVAVSLDQPALIMHSSGSTAFPKPRTLTHRFLLDVSQHFDYGGLKLEGEILAVHGLALYHAMGIFSALWPAVSGCIRAAPRPGIAQAPLTPELFLENIVESNATISFCVPSFLEAWSTDPSSLKTLKRLKAIFWGGAPLRTDAGRLLHREGIPIHPVYGATEFGLVSLGSGKTYAEGYEWFEFLPHVVPELVPEADGDVYEVVFKECEGHHLAVHNTEVNGIPAYSSSDLVERHKSNPGLFKIVGRKDDQIILSTGEKTNPGPLETIIIENPHVKNAIMFGRGRQSNGVLVEPASYEEAENLGVEKLRRLIWPSIETANDFAPAHSRIFKEMILVASAFKPFSYTVKNTARRGVVLKDYAEEIEAIYQAVQNSSNTNIPIPSGSSSDGGWTLKESLTFVGDVVHSIMDGAEAMGDEDDLFAFGCDSLQATYIRNTILHALRQVAPLTSVQNVPSNIVYQHPTIHQLAAVAAQVSRSATASVGINTDEERSRRLLKLVAKYTHDWPKHQPADDATNPTDETILLTGSTGGLGSQILAQLVAMPSVSRIFAFNRPARKSSRERHSEAFLDRGNDVTLLDSEKIVYVEGDTSVKGFNIKPELFAEIRDSVTTIIHNAWRVDFNLSLSSFEPAVQGVRHMVDLALQSPHPSPPRVMFTSSIGNVKAWADIPPVTEGPFTDMARVNASGYSESKWVSERILWAAGHTTSIRPVIARVGQLCGGVNGNWNSREWFPALVRAGQVVGGLPSNRGLVSFLPLHVAASAIIELRHTSGEYVHIVHPRPVPWEAVIGHMANTLTVPVIPYDEWLARLEASPRTDEDLHRNPALHLIDFYRASAVPGDIEAVQDREAMGIAMYKTTVTAAEAPSLSTSRLTRLGRDEVESWIGYWKSKGVLDV